MPSDPRHPVAAAGRPAPSASPALSPSPHALGAVLAAAAAVVLLARWLPLRFTWHPNALGIVSATTLARHPTQQETVWFALCVAVGAAGVWAAARWLGARRWSRAEALGAELAGGAMLAAALGLHRGAATLVAAGCAAALVAVALRAPAGSRDVGATPAQPPAPSRGRRAALGAVLSGLVLLRTPALWLAIGWTAQGASDALLAFDHWAFQVEIGQHLAWADALRRGGLHGRDIFCLYGPLYDWIPVALWALGSRSIAVWHLGDGLSQVLGTAGFAVLVTRLVRRPALWLLAPLGLVWINLRIGLPLLGLALLFERFSRGGAGWTFGAGLCAGLALLYSQEFGLAFTCCAALALAVLASGRDAAAFATGLAAPLVPVLGAYAWAGALAPMLRDLAAYPGWVMAGYGNQPFPSLVARLPLGWPPPGGDAGTALRLGLLAPVVCTATLGLCAPRTPLDPRHPITTWRAACAALRAEPRRLTLLLTAVFGLIACRSALGRSDLFHFQVLVPIASVPLLVGLDRWLDGVRAGGPALAIWRGSVFAIGLAALGVFDQVVWPSLALMRVSAAEVVRLAEGSPLPGRPPSTAVRVARWIRERSEPGEPMLFLPNDAAYYYLADRPNPTRFAVAHQIVTDAHRAEVLASLERRPPRFVVWDDAAMRLDGIPDEVVLGPQVMEWLERHYVPVHRIGAAEIWARREDVPEAGG